MATSSSSSSSSFSSIPPSSPSSSPATTTTPPRQNNLLEPPSSKKKKNKSNVFRVLRTVFRSFPIFTTSSIACKIPVINPGLGVADPHHDTSRVTGTLFGYRKGRVGPARRRVISTPELGSAGRPVILSTTELGLARRRVVLSTPELSDLLVISPIHKISEIRFNWRNYNINN
ncbi:hypothetical protein F2Q70_00039692 [Brassica cretica]|uniref:Uncharacterized protein n=1 Tax=Brassica cretica TaxID=69181 RepID=A0A8S9K6G5_BRACR|nr:hypothetical protein F2Q70_00039692 [Brassica cretica]